MKKTFDSAVRKAAKSRRTRLAVLATTMAVLGIAISTGAAALATDSRTIQSTPSSTYSTSTHSTSTHTTSTHTTSTETTSTQTTSTGTTSTVPTVSVAGVTGAGAAPGGGGGPGGAPGGGEGAPAGEAAVGETLPFTGLQVPAMILIALGMIAGGIVLRRKLEDTA